MHSGFEIPGIQNQQTSENSCAPNLLSMNQTHILDQIHTLPATQQLFLEQHHFLPPHHHQSRLNNQYGAATAPAGGSSGYFPVNFKLGLNEICTRNNYEVSEDALLRGSEQYEVAEARHMLHCWQNQEDSAIKQQPFWEPLPAEVSNEKSEIVDRQEHLRMNQKEAAPAACLESKSRLHFGELEAIYKRLNTTESNQTGPSHESAFPANVHLPVGFDHGSEASIGEEATASLQNARKKRKKKKKQESSFKQMINPTAEFFGNLVKQVMNHQENLHRKFAEAMERLEEERRARDEAWRNQELAYFEQEAEARAREKAEAEAREAMIISYLEQITGQKINFPILNPTERASSNDQY